MLPDEDAEVEPVGEDEGKVEHEVLPGTDGQR